MNWRWFIWMCLISVSWGQFYLDMWLMHFDAVFLILCNSSHCNDTQNHGKISFGSLVWIGFDYTILPTASSKIAANVTISHLMATLLKSEHTKNTERERKTDKKKPITSRSITQAYSCLPIQWFQIYNAK